MSKDPAFLFYSADFLVGVMDLTDEETGQYIKLICLQHQKGRLKKESIYRMFPNVSEFVLAKFEIDENGLYYNPRVEEEIEKRERFVESRQENGAKGGRPVLAVSPQNLKTDRFETSKPKQNLSENENENINENNIDIDNNLYFQQFNIFWEKYPKKVDKQEAIKVFLRLKPTAELFKQIMDAVEIHKRCKQWRDKQYIPYPSVWLRNKRWEDEIPLSEQNASSFDVDDLFGAAIERGRRSYRK